MHILLTQHLYNENKYNFILQHKTILEQYNFQPQSSGRFCEVC